MLISISSLPLEMHALICLFEILIIDMPETLRNIIFPVESLSTVAC